MNYQTTAITIDEYEFNVEISYETKGKREFNQKFVPHFRNIDYTVLSVKKNGQAIHGGFDDNMPKLFKQLSNEAEKFVNNLENK